MPVSPKILLESVLRNCDGKRINEQDVKNLARWNPKEDCKKTKSHLLSLGSFCKILQAFPCSLTLLPLRDAAKALGKDPSIIEPLVPVDLVIDHSVQVDRSGSASMPLKKI